MLPKILIDTINGKEVLIRGLWYLHETEGLPIEFTYEECKSRGIHPNPYTTADEMLKAGLSHKKISAMISKLFEIDVTDFLSASYEDQREIINKSLFAGNGESWMRDRIEVTSKELVWKR